MDDIEEELISQYPHLKDVLILHVRLGKILDREEVGLVIAVISRYLCRALSQLKNPEEEFEILIKAMRELMEDIKNEKKD